MIWQDLHHSELNVATLYALLQLRSQVFVVEQACAYQDIDGEDLRGANRHLLGWQAGQLVACARILVEGQPPGLLAIGRVIVAPEARGTGSGVALMRQALAICEYRWPGYRQVIGAQAHLQAFYQHQGFIASGEVYDEDGIPHITMYREPVGKAQP